MGAMALATLSIDSRLHSLELDLASNHVSDGAAPALAPLGYSSALRSLSLCLTDNLLGDTGASHLHGSYLIQ